MRDSAVHFLQFWFKTRFASTKICDSNLYVEMVQGRNVLVQCMHAQFTKLTTLTYLHVYVVVKHEQSKQYMA